MVMDTNTIKRIQQVTQAVLAAKYAADNAVSQLQELLKDLGPQGPDEDPRKRSVFMSQLDIGRAVHNKTPSEDTDNETGIHTRNTGSGS